MQYLLIVLEVDLRNLYISIQKLAVDSAVLVVELVDSVFVLSDLRLATQLAASQFVLIHDALVLRDLRSHAVYANVRAISQPPVVQVDFLFYRSHSPELLDHLEHLSTRQILALDESQQKLVVLEVTLALMLEQGTDEIESAIT